MKKQLLNLAFLATAGLAANAQTIVSTTPENKNVILEEFTGVNCVYCPQGHTIAQTLRDNNPGDVFLVNVHTGGYATPNGSQPDFRTQYGSALASQSNLAGYPAGTVNRHEFAGLQQNNTGTAIGRGNWVQAANQILTQSSYVNVAAEATVDLQTRQMTVLVEAYYTGASPMGTNKLNVALLQNNTLGPQTGGNMGNEYVHQHRLINFLTGQWGQDITTTSQGSFVSETFTYTIPADHNNIPIVLGDLEIVAYVAEGNQEIISGKGAAMTFTSQYNNEIELVSIDEIPNTCSSEITPTFKIYNGGNNDLTSLDIDYTFNNGTPATYTWTGNLATGQSETIALPSTTISLQATNTLDITLDNDEVNTNNNSSVTFDEAMEGSRNIQVDIRTDYYPTEISYEIQDGAGNVVASGGPYVGNPNGGGQDAFSTISENHVMPQADCYTIVLKDSYGDGWSGFDSNTLTPGIDVYSDGNQIYTMDAGDFGDEDIIPGAFSTNNALDVSSANLTNISLYPNPSNGSIFISELNNFNINVYDVSGKLVFNAQELNSNEEINVSSLAKGVYFVQLQNDDHNKTVKLLIE